MVRSVFSYRNVYWGEDIYEELCGLAGGRARRSLKVFARGRGGRVPWKGLLKREFLKFKELSFREGKKCAGLLLKDESCVLRPSIEINNRHGAIAYIMFTEPSEDFDVRNHCIRWKSSPMGRLERLMRARSVTLGLLIGAERWRFCHLTRFGECQYWDFDVRSIAAGFATDREKSVFLVLSELFFAESGDRTEFHDFLERVESKRESLSQDLATQVKRSYRLLFESFVGSGVAKGHETELSSAELQEMLTVLVMRIVFLLYAEERQLLPVHEHIYLNSYSLCGLWRESSRSELSDEGRGHWRRFLALCRLVHAGSSHSKMGLIAYGGQLFDPNRFVLLSEWEVTDKAFHEVLSSLLEVERGGQLRKVCYGAFDVEQIGTLYEGLLELSVEKCNSEWLLKGSEERRLSGSHYTPRELTQSVVRESLNPLIRPGGKLRGVRELLSLKICDPAVGSGAFLVQAGRMLGDALVEAWEERSKVFGSNTMLSYPLGEPVLHGQERLLPVENREELQVLARRLVVERCLYGVDQNALAIEIARLSLWIFSLAQQRPFSFVDHALKVGDSLMGVSKEDILNWGSQTEEERLPLLEPLVSDRLGKALEARALIPEISGDCKQDITLKEAALSRADRAMRELKLGADMLTGCLFRSRFDLSDCLSQFVGAKSQDHWEAIIERGEDFLNGRRPFHWELEFPEVFAEGGFDLFVGNPPFQGGHRIGGSQGRSYATYLRGLSSSRSGAADLCSYFFKRCFRMLKPGGVLGLLASNTIAQGCTRRVGLEEVIDLGGEIYFARSSIPWPGQANLVISQVHMFKGPWSGIKRLDNVEVKEISSRLDVQTLTEPKKLSENRGLAFQGSIPVGRGFVVSPSLALKWLNEEGSSQEVLYPYLSGQDLNGEIGGLPSRWIIDFRDRSEERARDYKACFEHVSSKVKKVRSRSRFEHLRENWWRHGGLRKELYRVVRPLSRVAVRCRISHWHIMKFVPADWVYSDGVIVFGFDDAAHLLLLQSGVHEIWSRRHSSSLRQDWRYIIGAGFETFPRPKFGGSFVKESERIVESLEEARRDLGEKYQCGLFGVYKRMHSVGERGEGLEELRAIHEEIDVQILRCYGWDDLARGVEHEFQELSGRSYWGLTRSSQAEILRRLAVLNESLYNEGA